MTTAVDSQTCGQRNWTLKISQPDLGEHVVTKEKELAEKEGGEQEAEKQASKMISDNEIETYWLHGSRCNCPTCLNVIDIFARRPGVFYKRLLAFLQ